MSEGAPRAPSVVGVALAPNPTGIVTAEEIIAAMPIVAAERQAQGLSVEPTDDQQMFFAAVVIASPPRSATRQTHCRHVA